MRKIILLTLGILMSVGGAYLLKAETSPEGLPTPGQAKGFRSHQFR